jgi:3-hydroxyisobutyrate dehydrogenase|tara:strand:- start:77 stop:1060 length:984 start_codon:yes stop_codon:yes gene_type:complete
MAEKLKVGVIGLGIMGSGMAYNLAKNGLLSGIFNRTKEKSEEFIERLKKDNVDISESPKELMEKVDVVLTCVSNDKAMENIVYGDNGIISGLSKGKVLLDSSTTSSELTVKIGKSLEEKGTHLVAGPMTGSKIRANDGTLTFMVGGNKEIAFSLKEVFEACGERAVYLGNADVAQDFKVLANQYQSDMLVTYAFKVLAGLAANAPMAGMQDVFDNTAAVSGVAKFKSEFICDGDFGETPDKVHFQLDLMLKDLRLAKKVRERTGINDVISEQTLKIFESASAAGFGEKDFASIVDYIQTSLEYNPTKKKITGNKLTGAELIVGKASR